MFLIKNTVYICEHRWPNLVPPKHINTYRSLNLYIQLTGQ
jgi:hypothetical protein